MLIRPRYLLTYLPYRMEGSRFPLLLPAMIANPWTCLPRTKADSRGCEEWQVFLPKRRAVLFVDLLGSMDCKLEFLREAYIPRGTW